MEEIKILKEKISDKHEDSIWYDGEIAKFKKPNGTELILIVAGDVEIRDKEGYVVFDGAKMRNDGINGGFESDEDLKKIGFNYDDKYYFELNNWFEVIFKKKGEDCFDCVFGDVAHGYKDGLDLLNCYIEDIEY